MERKIGDTFEYQGKTFVVKKVNELTCKGCYFQGRCGKEVRDITGECDERTDEKCVVFVEADEAPEQAVTEEDKKVNLLEILKYCPEGTELWSPLLGTLRFSRLEKGLVYVKSEIGTEWDFNPDTTITFRFRGDKRQTSQEPMIFPSKEQRDWSKVEYPQPVVLPETWEEFCETHGVTDSEAWIDGVCEIVGNVEETFRDKDMDRNLLPSKEACEQHLAMMQLHQLRDFYRQGWTPETGKTGWVITRMRNGNLHIYGFEEESKFLTFQDMLTARVFKQRFEDIIKAAGDMI